ncbi:hypothetical protein Tco_0624272 [Tanacetum coccineum]|uniref:Uncharacterized protein n=1 Tax=Tanacetum coccineum TaxID=301880 RepID=A0ABQ4WDE6_9ASTR
MAGTYDYLYKPCPDEPPENAAEDVKAAWKAEYKIHSDVACLMLGKMSPALQRQDLRFGGYPTTAQTSPEENPKWLMCWEMKGPLNKDFMILLETFNNALLGLQ